MPKGDEAKQSEAQAPEESKPIKPEKTGDSKEPAKEEAEIKAKSK